MGDRQLAHIEKIINIYPIEGADNIEMAQVLDFHVAVKKGEFKVGDFAVYIEIDSILPDGLPIQFHGELAEKKKLRKISDDTVKIDEEITEILKNNTRPEFEFLRAKNFRIKAMKYNKFGIISQGILFPTSILPIDTVLKEELDVTEIIGVTREIEDPEDYIEVKHGWFHRKMMRFKWFRKHFGNKKKSDGSWPKYFPPKSDEDQVQKVYNKILEKYRNEEFYLSEKLEGQNFSFSLRKGKKFFFIPDDTFMVCSRTQIKKGENGFTNTADKLSLEKKLRKINKSIFVRGEHCGGKIQGNIYKFPEAKVFVFEVYDFDEKRFYNYDELKELCNKWEFDMVPILDENFKLLDNAQDILKMSNGLSVFGNKVLREGIVIRLKKDPRVSFKARSPEYLVKHGK